MPAPFWLATAPCAGPSVAVNGGGKLYLARMLGFLQFGTLSNPPRVFGSLDISGSISDSYFDSAHPGHPTFPPGNNKITGRGWSGSFSMSGYTNDEDFSYEFIAGITDTTGTGNFFVGGTFGLNGGIMKPTYSGSPVTYGSGADPATFLSGNETGLGNVLGPNGGSTPWVPAPLNISGADSASIDVAGTTVTVGDALYTIDGSSITFSLGDEDSDSAALARAISDGGSNWLSDIPGTDYGFANGLYSLQETRTGTDAVAYAYKVGKYWLIGSEYVLPLSYRGQVQWERRTAAGNGQILVTGSTSGYGSWADADLDDFTFTPDATSYETAHRDMPTAAGYQYRIKSITITQQC